jgi:hypothetical protein
MAAEVAAQAWGWRYYVEEASAFFTANAIDSFFQCMF